MNLIPQKCSDNLARIPHRYLASSMTRFDRFIAPTIAISLTLSAMQSVATAQTRSGEAPAQPVKSDGQRLKTMEASQTTTASARLELTFGGSLCPVCLVAFQRRLSDTPGVLSAKVESLNVEQAEHSGHPPKRAHAIVEFDASKISKTELESMIRHNDFQFIKAHELPATNP